MKITQQQYLADKGWLDRSVNTAINPQLVLAFGSTELIGNKDRFSEIRQLYPSATILCCSTAAEIIDTTVHNESISLTAVEFEHTALRTAVVNTCVDESPVRLGQRLASMFDVEDLNSVLVISDGHHVNGSDLVKGISKSLPEHVIVTGGLAGDGVQFQRTLVGLNEVPTEGCVAAIAFYGKNLQVGYGSGGGWDSFGPQRLITRSKGNILYELDGQPALEVYKKYLGEYANELPSAGLLFPLSVRNGGPDCLVRTILNINEEEKSLIFAGNVPEGSYARLMKAGLDRLIDGAAIAAQHTQKNAAPNPELAILISCVGRKLVLDQRVEEEVEVVRTVYGADTALAGFYSYGEICPSHNSREAELHNQTMTITTFREVV